MTELAQQCIEREIQQRTGYLDLGRCGLTQMPDLSGLHWLHTLVLSNDWWDRKQREWISSQNEGKPNRLKDPPSNFFPEGLKKVVLGGGIGENWKIEGTRFLEKLTGLASLDLSFNQISDGRFLGNLTGLTTLDLSSNQISDWRFLGNLTGLTSLALSNNKISDGRFLGNLTGLTSLNLSSNQISDGRFLEKLTGLNTLNLSNNQISDGRFLGNLTGLASLNLSFNKISDGRFLEKLTGLNTLNLSFNKISDWRFLGNLTGLTMLDLSSNQINDLRFLENLTGLTSLDLSDNKISDGRFLGNLAGLTSLDLSSNQISDGRFLGNLTGLTTLDLSSNQISDWRFLGNLTGLTSLALSNNKISDWRFLGNLTGLTSLSLSNNKISDGQFLGNLTGLNTLNLRNNKISDWRFLGNLTGLTTLFLGNNKISDRRFLENLTGLNTLYLSSNQISDGRFLGNLTGLNTLDLQDNQISDGRFLEKLTGLTTIDVSNNQITDLTPFQYFFEKKGMQVVWKEWYETRVGEINVQDNPLQNPPVEIVQQGNEAILNYFKQIAEQGGTAPLYEARLIMVGEPGAGKTSLTEKLLDEAHEVKPDDPKKKSTLGINVKEHWDFADCRRPGERFAAHIWDFGGQEIQYMTHQFFLTPEALYVLVADDRKQHTLFPYWFEVIRLLGRDDAQGHSPVLVVLNERNNKSITNFDHNEYRLRYPDMSIEVCEVDLCDTNLMRFRQLRERIQEALCRLPHVGRPLPAKWPRIREDMLALKNAGRNYISRQKFREVCAAHKVTQEDDLALISLYLHRLGAILHFQNDKQLKDFIVISPAWALKAIYVVLEDKAVEKANGFFSDTDLDRYWQGMTETERDNVLNLMKKENFEIVYPLQGGYIAPQLLSKIRPDFAWDGSASLKCQYYYRFMPKGIVTRLIVRKHNHIKSQDLVWARGAVFQFAGCDILVVEQETERDGIIQIEVRGKGRDGIRALDFVRNEIDEIHEKWFSDIDFQPRVPCHCDDCRDNPKPTFFNLNKLIQRLNENRHTIECDFMRVKDVPVRLLLEGVYDRPFIESQMEKQHGRRGEEMHLRLSIDNREVTERLDRIEETTRSTEINTNLIRSNQEVHSRHLQSLLHFAGQHEAALKGVFAKIDALPEMASADLARIDDLLERHFGALLERLPTSHEIVGEWKKATAKSPDEVDMKWKLKFKLPLIFAEVEKELTWDGKKMLNSIRQEITAFAGGEKPFRALFLED